jgi:lipopolysaccharide export system protein LptA
MKSILTRSLVLLCMLVAANSMKAQSLDITGILQASGLTATGSVQAKSITTTGDVTVGNNLNVSGTITAATLNLSYRRQINQCNTGCRCAE